MPTTSGCDHLRQLASQEIDMGLLDVLNGMQNGPGGQRSSGGGGMSPMTMALLGLLAYKALKSSGGLGNVLGGGQAAPAGTPGGVNPANPGGGGLGDILGGLFGGGASGSAPGGNLGGLIPGGLGGLLGGAGAGSVLSGGLGNLIKDLQNNGQGHVAQSWVADGPNQPIAPESLEAAAGAGTLDALAKQTGMNRDELLAGLSQQLPALVDHLASDGRVPTQEEAARMV
jgi:uncharacterized protein YidB (DUF937 family)